MESDGLKRANAAERADDALSPEELRRERRNSWIGLLIGIPAFMGVIYLLYWLMKQFV
ncbi:MAG: hypothetical protein Q4B99_00075 [Clostridia bacterium]|nr:hypothetical protein [Clostridia bacterium]